MGTSPLNNVVVVLNEPQDLVNIAGTIRAMTNMGLFRLRLVRPKEFSAYRISGIAHRAGPDGEYIATLFEVERLPADFPTAWAKGGGR